MRKRWKMEGTEGERANSYDRKKELDSFEQAISGGLEGGGESLITIRLDDRYEIVLTRSNRDLTPLADGNRFMRKRTENEQETEGTKREGDTTREEKKPKNKER